MAQCRHFDTNLGCLGHVPIFAGLTRGEAEEIAGIASTRSFQKGESVYRAGDQGGTLFVLDTGRVKIYRLSVNGREQVLRVAGPGEFIGELSLFSALALTDNAQALDDTVMCVLQGDRLKVLMGKYPSIAFKVMDVMSRRLEQADQLIQSISLSSVTQRLAQALLERADGRDVVVLQTTKGDFASQLGMSQETLSRKLKALQEEKLIELSGHRKIIIRDRRALEGLESAPE